LIEEYHNESMSDFKEVLLYEVKNYQGGFERNDDITVIGFKV